MGSGSPSRGRRGEHHARAGRVRRPYYLCVDNPISQAIAAARRPTAARVARPRLLIAGATGVLGNAVLQRLVGMQRASHTQVLTRLPIRPGLRHVSAHLVPQLVGVTDDFASWPTVPSDIAVVMFDPPRMFHGRERALWTPAPQQLAGLGRWIQRCGVDTLVVILPHAQGTLPQALKHGLANLDEQALAALDLRRLLIVRTAQKPGPATQRHFLHRTASWMLGISSLMVPRSALPVRASKVAEFVDQALLALPAGVHVAAPELVWTAVQGDTGHMRQVISQWLGRSGAAMRAASTH